MFKDLFPVINTTMPPEVIQPHASSSRLFRYLLFLVLPGCQALFPAYVHGVENPDRGLVAFAAGAGEDGEPAGVHLSWRLLSGDGPDAEFKVYRDGRLLQSMASDAPTFFTDVDGRPGSRYEVRVAGDSALNGAATSAMPHPWIDIPLHPSEPVPWRREDAPQRFRGYRVGEASAGDLDGDGQWELVLKWVGIERDNSRDGLSSPTLLQAIEMDGRVLWTIDLGINIRSGAHYTPFIVFDLDGDGASEIACRTSDGTVDGDGAVLATAGADHRDRRGRVLRAPEFLSVFDGRTGRCLQSVDYQPSRGDIRVWGDDYGNRSERHLSCVALYHGGHPRLITARGYYYGRQGVGPGRTAITAWTWNGAQLEPVWTFDTLAVEKPDRFIGQGTHSIASGDIDADGRDEILYGSMAVDDDGSPLYSTGFGHGDAHHLGDFDPSRPGLEFYMPHESARPGEIPAVSFREAATGTIIWSVPADRPRDVGRAAMADLSALWPGAESWGPDRFLRDISGKTVGPAPRTPANFLIWWDGDVQREILNSNWIADYDPDSEDGMRRLFTAEGFTSTNGSKSTPVLSADLIGDWREELLLLSRDGQSLRLFISPIPTGIRFPCLMLDPLYRNSIAWQNVGYNQPPHPGRDPSTPVP